MSASQKPSLLSRHRQLAPSASIRVSPLCLGTMTFGDLWPEKYGECSKESAFAVLDTFFSQGGNFIDTANGYRGGQSEEWLGEWMASRKVRDQIVLATKYTSPYRAHEQGIHIHSNYSGNGMKSMRLSLNDSLKKLQTDYIDLFYVHWWDYTVSIPELMHALDDLVKSGKVLYLGVSDTPAWVVSKANQYARDHGLRQFVVYQGMWNAAMRDFERDIIPMCRDEGMGLCPYGVLNQGRFQTEAGFREREDQQHDGRKMIPLSERDKTVSKILERLANKKGSTVTNIGLAYVMQKAPYVFPIVGGRKVSHIEGSIEGLAVALTEDEVVEVEGGYDFDYGFPHTFLSGVLMQNKRDKGAGHPSEVGLTKAAGTFDWVEAPKAIRPPGSSS